MMNNKLKKYAITIEETIIDTETYIVEAEDSEAAKIIVENAYNNLFIGPDGFATESCVKFIDTTSDHIKQYGEEEFNSRKVNLDTFILGIEYFPDNESVKQHLTRVRDKRLRLLEKLYE